MKVVFIGGSKGSGRAVCLSRFVKHSSGLWSPVCEQAVGDEGDEGDNQDEEDDDNSPEFASSSCHGSLLLYIFRLSFAICHFSFEDLWSR